MLTLDSRGTPPKGSPAMWRHLTCYLPDDLWDWLEAYLAQPEALSLSGVVRLAVVQWLRRVAPEDEP